MNTRLLAMLAAVMILASGCSSPAFPPIHEDRYLFTLNLRDSSLTFIDYQGERLADWKLEEMFTGGVLFPDQDRLLLYGTQLDHAALYSLSEGRLLEEWKVPEGTTGALYLKESKEIVLANKEDRSLHFYNEEGRETDIVRTGKYPMSLAAYQDCLYVINYQDTILSEVDLKKKKVSREFAIPSSSAGLMIQPEEKELWVGGHGHGKKAQSYVQIYSLETGKKKQKVEAPVMPVDFIEHQGRYYVISHGSNMVYMFNERKKQMKQHEVGANPFTLAAIDDHIVTAGFDNDKLYYLNKDHLKIEKQVQTGKGPFRIFVKEQEK
ncbi:YncE family protein [Bacillus xiapuensis]|uniref:YncE family protein n=1 Tax=Bacillus xiapuensis TaxID=2014075 RepID=UPI0012FE5265|nr:hypothetical protein [Bacillus xiapuensis]